MITKLEFIEKYRKLVVELINNDPEVDFEYKPEAIDTMAGELYDKFDNGVAEVENIGLIEEHCVYNYVFEEYTYRELLQEKVLELELTKIYLNEIADGSIQPKLIGFPVKS